MSARTTIATPTPLRLDPDLSMDGVSWPGVFGRDGRVEIEVGIGKGRFLLASAESRPDVSMLGIEWANRYLKIAEVRAVKRGLENVRFLRVDAKEFLPRAVPHESVDVFYVFYPDPWPKKRHHKRRFFHPPTPDHVAAALKDGGMLHVATDHVDYWAAILEVLEGHAEFERLPEFGGPDFPMPVDEPLTNFEAKYRVQGRDRLRGSWRRPPRG